MAQLVAFGMMMALLLGGCSHAPEPKASPPAPQTYQTRGVVREISVDRRTTRINHEAIPGFMPRMTMNFTVLEPSELEFVEVGDVVQFQLRVTDDDHWIFNVRKEGQTNTPPNTTQPSQLVAPPELKIGDLLPDQPLLSEKGQNLRLQDFRGQPLAITFIFTRCPLPNFCPKMSFHFRDTAKLLKNKDWPATLPKPKLLSLSFDPDYDTPQRLQRYATAYRSDASSPWTFASIPKPDVTQFTARCGLSLEFENGSIGHNLRTLVIAPDGRITSIFKGNDWTPTQLYEALQASASGTTPEPPRPESSPRSR